MAVRHTVRTSLCRYTGRLAGGGASRRPPAGGRLPGEGRSPRGPAARASPAPHIGGGGVRRQLGGGRRRVNVRRRGNTTSPTSDIPFVARLSSAGAHGGRLPAIRFHEARRLAEARLARRRTAARARSAAPPRRRETSHGCDRALSSLDARRCTRKALCLTVCLGCAS